MSEILKYKKALNFRANPRYLRRDFIVPLYTGTEPDIYEDKKPNMNDPGMVVNPSRILPKNFTDDMPFVTDENNPEQLELNEGGRIGFNKGGVSILEFAKRQKFTGPHSFRKYLGPSQSNSTVAQSILDALSKAGITFSDKRGRHREKFLQNVNDKSIKKFEQFMKESKKELNLPRSRFETMEQRKQIKKFVTNKIKNKEYVSLQTINKQFPDTNDVQIRKSLSPNIINKLGKEEQKAAMTALNIKRGILKTKDQAAAVDYILDKISKGEDISKKELAKVMNVRQGEVERKMGNLITNIYGTNSGKNKNSFLNKFTYDERNNIVQTLFNSEEFKDLYSSRVRADINSALPENSVLREEALKKLNNFVKVKKEIEKKFGDVIELEHPLARNIIATTQRSPGQAYLRVIPVSKEFNRYKSYFDSERGKIQRKILDALEEGKDTTNLVKELKAKETAIQTLFGNYDIGKISSKGNIIRYGSKSLFESDLNQLLKDNLVLVDNLKNNINLNKENLIPLFNEAKLNVKILDKALELKSPKVTTTDIDDIINKIENVKTKSAIDIADELSKEDARAVCGKLNLGGLPKGCAELAKENPDKFLKTVAETSTDTKFASKATQALNFTKGAGKAAEEIIGFGRGVVGRTLGPLAALNSALEQWTAGNIAEGFRKIGDLVDLTTLVGDPFGFEKSRREGTEADIKKVIGEKNYGGFENIKAASDEYVQLLDIDKKLKRAEQASQNQFDPDAPGVDQNYIDQLKTQKSILEKNIEGTKYGDVEDNLLNYANLLYQDILKRKPNASDSDKYAFKTAVFEQLNRAFKPEIVDLYKEELNKKFGPDINILQKQQEDAKPLSERDQNVIESRAIGAAEGGYIDYVKEYKKYARGGRINLSDGGNGNRPKISRRGFLGFLAGAASLPFVGKLMKGKKTAQAVKIGTKVLPEAKGMPKWFNPLITKIMNEGVDISPKATRVEDIKTIKKLEIPTPDGKGTDTIIMTKYPDGSVEVDAEVLGGGAFDSPFTLTYKPPKLDIDLATGKPIKDPGSFYVVEQRPKPDYNDPGNFEIDYETMYVDDAISDIERIEKIATGKIIKPQKVEQRAGARKFVESNPSEDIVNRYGDSEIEYDRMKDEGLLDEIE